MTAGAPAALAPNAEAKREERARPSARGFALILAQILVFVALSWQVHHAFFSLACAVAVGFTVHYWTPYRWKEACWLTLTFAGGAYVASPHDPFRDGVLLVALVVAAALVIYGIVASPLPYAARLPLVVAFFAAMLWAGGAGRAVVRAPTQFYTLFGGVFMTRILTYMYDARRFKARPPLRDYVRYFFMLPGFKLNAPIIDYQKLGPTVYARDGQRVAQQGIYWIARGFVHYTIYDQLQSHLHFVFNASAPRSPRMVAIHLFCAYSFYLRTSGQIHMYLGIMHLFGFDLPEAYHWFWFSHSPINFWRRANIYWKDAMIKVVYFPLYFALRKKSDVGAKVLALFGVFTMSWALHMWQISWWSDLRISVWRAAITSPPQALMWAIFAVVCAGNLAVEIRAEDRPKPPVVRLAPRLAPPDVGAGFAGLVERARLHLVERVALPRGVHPARAALQIAGTWLFMAALFSLVRAPSISAWLFTLKFWN